MGKVKGQQIFPCRTQPHGIVAHRSAGDSWLTRESAIFFAGGFSLLRIFSRSICVSKWNALRVFQAHSGLFAKECLLEFCFRRCMCLTRRFQQFNKPDHAEINATRRDNSPANLLGVLRVH
jgi:hypothetical protein